MKKKYLFNGQRHTNRRFYLFLFAMFMAASTAFAGLVDNSATATAVSVPDTILMSTDLYSASTSSDVSTNLLDGKLDNSGAGNFWIYKISSTEGGEFNAIVKAASKRSTGKINVSLYTTDSTLVYPGFTLATYNGQWGDWNSLTNKWADYLFPLGKLEANTEYLMKVMLVDHGTNIRLIAVAGSEGSIDATLSTLTVDSITPAGFAPMAPASGNYSVLLPVGTTTATVAATANHDSATIISGLGDMTLVNGQGSATVSVVAELGDTLDYMVNAFTPKNIEDATQVLNLVSNATMISKSNMTGHTDAMIENTGNGDYFEYQIYTTTSGMYSTTLSIATGRDNSATRVDYYKVGDTTMVIGDTVAIAKDGWQTYSPYTFPMDLEANEQYIMRINVLTAGWNMTPIKAFQVVDSVQTDKVRMVPTVEGDSSSIFSIMDHNTGINGQIVVKTENNSFDSIKKGSWGKFQIKSSKTGIFDVVLNLGSGKTDGEVCVSLYNTLTGEWIADSDTASTNTGGWSNTEDLHFRFALDSGVIYTTKINFITGSSWICNVYGVSVEEYITTNDASLSGIMVDNVSIEGFNATTLEYSITLPKGSTEVPATTVTTTVEGSMAVVTDAASLMDTTFIVVTSEDSTVVNTYSIAYEVVGPHGGVAASIPGVVEFEHWNVGGEGVAYHDTDAGGPRTETNGDRTNVAYTGAGEWLLYTVNVETAGDYQVRAQIASRNDLGQFILTIDGDSITTATMKSTGAWQTYATNIVGTVTLTAGEHDIKWEMSGTVQMNLDYFQLLDVNAISSDATLASINLNDSTELEGFDAATMMYTVMVDSVQEIETMISAMATDSMAMVSISQASMVDSSKAVITVTAYDMVTVSTYEVMFVVEVPASLNAVRAEANVELYPNPVQNVLNISAESAISSVQLYSISGALVNNFTGLNSREVSLNINVDKGVYFVSVLTAEGSITKQLIKQ